MGEGVVVIVSVVVGVVMGLNRLGPPSDLDCEAREEKDRPPPVEVLLPPKRGASALASLNAESLASCSFCCADCAPMNPREDVCPKETVVFLKKILVK